MILQALYRYYDILADDPHSGIAPWGYCSADVSFALNLSPQGELLDIFPLFDKVQRGNKSVEVPRRMIVPERVKRSSGIYANFLCDNGAFVLGLSDKDKVDPQYAARRFEAFRQFNKGLLVGAKCPAAKAVMAFLDKYNPQDGKENPLIGARLEEILKGVNFVFKLEGSSGDVHQDAEIHQIWEAYKAQERGLDGQCLVTGETAPVKRLHPSLKGIAGANPSGATLVGFDKPAYESYGKKQGANSPVSERAAFAYSTALNYLLSSENKNRKFTIGDTTVVYWAESQNRAYATIFASLFGIDQGAPAADEAGKTYFRDKKAEKLLQDIADKVKCAEKLALASLPEELDRDTPRFCVLGLAPNNSRVSVRFFHRAPFLKMVQKIMAHYADLQIIKEYADQPDQIPIWQILGETVSKKSSDKKASPLMAGAVFRSILNNTPYPAALYYAVINRIRADVDDSSRGIKKINYVRAAMIKAYLTRKYRNQNQTSMTEVICMKLNEQSTNQAYLLGRLFAVLEKAQQDAAGPKKRDTTIKDSYFSSACAAPATVFPLLLRLSQHHISKAEYGYASDKRIEEIMNLFDVNNNPIPAHLSLDEQGIFILGYYHQRAAIFAPKTNGNTAEELKSEN